MKVWIIIFGILLLSGLLLSWSPAFASCGQAFCPIETSTLAESPLRQGKFYFNVVYEYIDQDEPRIGTNKASVGEIAREHDEVFTQNNTVKFTLDYGITSRLTLGLVVPFLDRHHAHIERVEHHDNHERESGGGSLEEPESTGGVDRWTYQELGDLQLTARYLWLQPETPLRPAFSLIAGMKLPTGRTGVKNDTGETAELTLQPGNGSWDGIIGVSYVQNFSAATLIQKTALAPLFVTVLGRFPVDVGKFGYEPGSEIFVNIGFAYPLFQKLDLLAQINFHYQDRDSVGHAPGVEQADTGRETLFLSPGVRYHLTRNMNLYFLMQFPVYQRVNGIQATSDWNLTSGISYRFDPFSSI